MWQRLNILFFHKASKKEDIPLAVPKLYIDNNQIQRSESIKFLLCFSIKLDMERAYQIHCKKYWHYISTIFRSKPYLDKKRLWSLYYSYIHSYISCANFAWGNTYLSNLKKISSQQKHLVRIIYNKMKYESIRELLRSLKVLNVYQINILNNAFYAKSKRKHCANCISR